MMRAIARGICCVCPRAAAFFVAPQRRLGRALEDGDAQVRRYVFTHPLDNAPLRAVGAAHGVDLPFIFHNLNIGGPAGTYVPSSAEVALADATVGIFSRFIATGHPNGRGSPHWPRLSGDEDRYLNFDTTIGAAAGFRAADSDFWDRVLPSPYPYAP
jgi:para-nitrobenzyl esterase